MEGAAGPFVRLLHPHDLVHPWIAEEVPFIQGRRITHKTKHHLAGALTAVHLESAVPHFLFQLLDSGKRCVLFHYNNHDVPPLPVQAPSILRDMYPTSSNSYPSILLKRKGQAP